MSTKANPHAPNDTPEGKYANYFMIGYNAYEFVIDFGQYFPENDQANLFTRIVTSPVYARSLLELLQRSISQYNEAFGAMEDEISGE